jgi:sec-independent protein translocase protein TatC|tara:strand:+ start:412 stop:1191 length:780 start_codon:yes stop_codon:yes gene_type:complete
MDGRQRDIIPMAEFVNLVRYLRGRITLLIGVFIFGLVLGYPVSGDVISWLLQANGYLPDEVLIIITQPMEVILLRLRIATQIGIAMAFTMIIIDISWNGSKIISKSNKDKLKQNGSKITSLLLVSLSSIGLGIIGAVYAHYILIPMLLDFLANDASNVGLTNTWQLQSWLGFVIGLFFGSIMSFQTPLVTLLLLRTGMISRSSLIENRGIIWFFALLLGAVLSPPDPISMFLVGGPILLLLEVALLIDKLFTKSQSSPK